jgi:hypothetical protein
MSFKMRCPKCKGLDYSIERDNRTFGAVAQAFELVFHCRCGKQMFGEQILKEYEAQKKDWEAGAGDRSDDESVEGPSHVLLRETAEGREATAEVRPMLTPKADPPAKGVAAKPAKPKAAKEPKKAAKPAPEPVAGAEVCSWPGCGKPARKNSKYCSRACSNKNARHRHKLRAKTGD